MNFASLIDLGAEPIALIGCGRKLRPEAQTIHEHRAPLAEFPNGWTKAKLNVCKFSTRGMDKVRCEAIWRALTFNL